MAGIIWELFDILLSVICWIGRVTIAVMIAFSLLMVFALPWIVTYGDSITTMMRNGFILYDVLLGCVCVELFVEV